MSCPFRPQQAAENVPDSAPSGESVREERIPQPPPKFLLGNFPDMDLDFPARGLQRLSDLYGDIYQLQLATRTLVVSSQELIHEISDQDRFFKEPSRTLREIRALTGDGLFTSAHEDGREMKAEPNWWKAHRLLVPAFGPLGLRKMFDDMQDLSAQLILRWDRMGPEHVIDCSDDFTRLAFDTIGLCGFGYRFNEFYTDNVHPFAVQMGNVLKLSGMRANRLELQNALHRWEEQARQEDTRKMHALCDQIIADRKAHPQPDAKDLLNIMLTTSDRETGEKLSDENIRYNLATFLVAGHETTSATLSFMWYNLLKNPDKLLKAQQQVDEIAGDRVVTLDMVPKFTYLDACIKETLRLNSPIQLFGVIPKADTYLAGGKYKVLKGDSLVANLKALHHDPRAWGDDHHVFRPERFLNGGFQALPPDSWKPFGNGMRACIGRGFAEQEMLINTAMILQHFSPEMADPSYELKLKSTLTVKPQGFSMRVRRRPGKSHLVGIPGGISANAPQAQEQRAVSDKPSSQPTDRKVSIFYGGNAGTCEGFAQALETKLQEVGVQTNVSGLDSATENLSKDAVNIIITSSYEGKPPDNAKKFISWLQTQKDDNQKLQGVRYSVMGVGNSDWASTFHRIPKLVDERLSQLGATTFVPASYSNVKTDLIGPFEDWSDAVCRTLSSKYASPTQESKPTFTMKIEHERVAKQLGDPNMGVGTILNNELLADTSVGLAKRRLDVRLPENMHYEAGDYLAIQPRNPDEVVHRVMRHFGFTDHTRISFEGSKKKFLPQDPTPIGNFLHEYIELGTPVTKKQLGTMLTFAKEDGADENLKSLVDDSSYASLLKNRYTILDILEEHTSIQLPFDIYVDMLLPLTPRQYSISSSPMAPGKDAVASITYDVHTSPSLSGHGIFEGVSSTFLSLTRPGDHVSCAVRSTNVNFRMPGDTKTPIIMFCAGTGIAPMRAFLEERAAIAEAGSRTLGPALLFYGCRDPVKDYLYKDELAAWEAKGIVEVFNANSQDPNAPYKYVQDAIWGQKDRCAQLFLDGGKIYLCGSAAKLGRSCAEVCKKVWLEKHPGKSETDADEWLDSVKTDRYISDVY